MATFHIWLAEHLVDNDLTVTDLSHMLDIFDGIVEDWIAARAVPTSPQCVRIAELFEEPAVDVLAAAGHPTSP